MANQDDICKSKHFYDTEFEAQRAAAIAGSDFKAGLVPYRCGNHWHIANVRKELRSKYRAFNRSYCKYCDCFMRPSRYNKHITLPAHQGNVKRYEDSEADRR